MIKRETPLTQVLSLKEKVVVNSEAAAEAQEVGDVVPREEGAAAGPLPGPVGQSRDLLGRAREERENRLSLE